MIYVLLADGFEEVEALTVVDVLRRAGQQVETVSIAQPIVTGSHQIAVKADRRIDDIKGQAFDMLVLPGGLPGTDHLQQDERVIDLVLQAQRQGKYIAAICAAPKILGALGMLEGKRATSFPSVRDKLTGATVEQQSVVVDGNIITGRSIGGAMDFSLELTALLCGREQACQLAESMLYTWK